MKRFLCLLIVLFVLGATACGGDPSYSEAPSRDVSHDKAEQSGESEMPKDDDTVTGGKVLVVYFSCTQNTEKIADYIIEKTGGTRYEIQPEEPYTEDDLKYYTNGRADREQADPASRPAIAGSVDNMEQYGTVFIGYPIWHGQAPKIIYTFLESYDFSGKTIIPFCTSHSSGIGSSDTNLHELSSDAEWKNGKRFSGDADKQSVCEWVESVYTFLPIS